MIPLIAALVVSCGGGVTGPAWSEPWEGARLRLVQAIDCASPGRDNYVSDGSDSVVDSPLGPYRQAGPERRARFAYRLRVENVQRPHLLVITYPDDKPRTMDIVGNSPNFLASEDLQTGVACGAEWPASGRMRQHTVLFWPREQELALVLMTALAGHPAAAARIELYKVEGGLPPLQIREPESGGRMLGLQWEDASLAGGLGCPHPLGQVGPEDWALVVSRLTEYMRFTGCNLLKYPIVLYQGPLYPSEVEPGRRERLGYHPTEGADWVRKVLDEFGRQGLCLIPSLTLLRTPSLLALQNTDEEAVARGADTVNQVLRNNGIRASADVPGARPEEGTGKYGPGPIFNPLHPTVRGKVLALIEEILTKYGDAPAFKGLSINLWAESPLWFGSLESDYSDLTVGRFEQETGVRVPVRADHLQRFSGRHDWLIANARAKWIEWRCEKVRELILEILRRVRAKRSDLTLTLALWVPYPPLDSWGGRVYEPGKEASFYDHPYPGQHGAGSGNLGLARWRPEGQPFAEIYREGGLDLERLKGIEGLLLERVQTPCDYRWRWTMFGWRPEHVLAREIDFDPGVVEAVRSPGQTATWFYNRYYEDAAGSETPLPGLWWAECPWRVSAITPAPPHFMEYFANALASLDANEITDGGITLGLMGHEAEVRNFARAYRALPRGSFQDYAGTSDPVQMRTRWEGEVLWLYLVNREAYPATVALGFQPEGVSVVEAGSGRAVGRIGERLLLRLGPYGLRAFKVGSASKERKASDSIRIATVSVRVPERVKRELLDRLTRLQAAAHRSTHSDEEHRTCERLITQAQEALAAGHLSRARHLLWGYEAVRLLGPPDAPA